MLKVGESLLRSAFVTGKSTVGGNVCFVSGSGRAGASGESGRILVLTQNAGIKGTSGARFLATGTASLGDSGAICLGSGVAKRRRRLFVASVGVGDSGNGGDAAIYAGSASRSSNKGGLMALSAGRSHAVAFGAGGSVTCGAGRGRTDSGGVFYIYSGMSVLSTSGAILLRTTDAGSGGASGELALTSGTASCGDSGRLNFETGTAASGTGGFSSIALQIDISASFNLPRSFNIIPLLEYASP